MYSSMMLGFVFTFGAPAAKEPPKTDLTIVGEWVAESCVVGGINFPLLKDRDLRFAFAADGNLTITDGKTKPEATPYKLDAKKDPAEIDIDPIAESKEPGSRGILKIEGDTLTLRIVEGKKTPRPTKFESSKENVTLLYTFKRTKK